MDSGRDAIKAITPAVMEGLPLYYDEATSQEELQNKTADYVKTKLEAGDFYAHYDRELANTVVSAIIGTFISFSLGSLSLVSFYVSVVPVFVYEFSLLWGALNVLELANSFNGRYYRRVEIEYGI